MLSVRKNGLPAYRRIQGTIVKRLELGLLKPGDLVDSDATGANSRRQPDDSAARTHCSGARGHGRAPSAAQERLLPHQRSISTN